MRNQATLYYCQGNLPTVDPVYPLLAHEKQQAKKRSSIYLHQRQILRHLILNFGTNPTDLHYLPSHKPMLKPPYYISMSHDKDIWVVLLAKHPIGIDIQQRLPKNPNRFAAYFHCHPDDLLKHWMIREAYAKLTETSLYTTRHQDITQIIKAHHLYAYPISAPNLNAYAVSICKTLEIPTLDMKSLF
ncbi:hypothetical protein OAT84_04105 [Gammaproteobacteria bacterium]|nr:hypothetical protein [Gammaproteobacteria bacterium]